MCPICLVPPLMAFLVSLGLSHTVVHDWSWVITISLSVAGVAYYFAKRYKNKHKTCTLNKKDK